MIKHKFTNQYYSIVYIKNQIINQEASMRERGSCAESRDGCIREMKPSADGNNPSDPFNFVFPKGNLTGKVILDAGFDECNFSPNFLRNGN